MTTNDIRLEDLGAHADCLRSLARVLVQGEAVDDVAQEAMLAAWQHPPDATRPLRPWFARVVANLQRMRIRSDRQRRQREEVWARDAAEGPLTPEDLLVRHESIRRLAAAVTALPEPFRSTVLLRYSERKPAAEIARLQGVPAGTVRWRLSQALSKLRDELDREHGGDRARWMLAFSELGFGARTGAANATWVTWVLTVGAAGLILVTAAYLIRELAGDRGAGVAETHSQAGSAIGGASAETPPAPGDQGPQPARGFLVPEDPPPVQNDPAAPDYDPLKLMTFAKPARVFQAEPRVCDWAASMEVAIERNALAELTVRVPEARLDELECRRSSCKLTIAVPADGPRERILERVGAAMVALQRPMIAPMVGFPESDAAKPWELPVILQFSPDVRERAAYDRWYQRDRAAMAAALSGPETPEENRPANPPAKIAVRDPGSRRRACEAGPTAPLAPPVRVPESLTPLEEMRAAPDPGAFALQNAFSLLLAERVQGCGSELPPGTVLPFSLVRARGWVEASPQQLRASRVEIEIGEGAPLVPEMADCLARALAGTLTAKADHFPFPEVADWAEAKFHLGERTPEAQTPPAP